LRICLAADDPTLFRTTTLGEYRRARRVFGFASEELEAMLAVAASARAAAD
jgi:adenosine deaminase